MRNAQTSLKSEILDNASRFEFFEAARSLLLITGEAPDSPVSTGNSTLRFRSSATKNHPAGEIEKLEQNDGLIELYTHVIGLFGPCGVLPHPDKDMVAGGEPNALMRDFLNIFNSRIVTLFFHAWLTNRNDVALELHRREVYPDDDAFSLALLSLCGLGLPSTREQRHFPDDVFAGSVGYIARPVRSASSIQRCLQTQFGIPVKVEEFINERSHLPIHIRSRIGSKQGVYNALGKSACVGNSVPASRQRFEIQVGPLNREEFESLYPFDNHLTEQAGSNVRFKRLVELTRSILSRTLDFNIRLTILPEAVSPAKLGQTRLGFDSWVCAKPQANQRSDTLKMFKWDVNGKQSQS